MKQSAGKSDTCHRIITLWLKNGLRISCNVIKSWLFLLCYCQQKSSIQSLFSVAVESSLQCLWETIKYRQCWTDLQTVATVSHSWSQRVCLYHRIKFIHTNLHKNSSKTLNTSTRGWEIKNINNKFRIELEIIPVNNRFKVKL